MSVSERFYVYIYYMKDGTPFYVGKGQGKRMIQHRWCKSKNPYVKEVIYEDLRSTKLLVELTETQALSAEWLIIKAIGTRKTGNGPLVNLIHGGAGGLSGSKFSEKEQLEIARRYKAGESSRVLAKAFGVTYTGILHALDLQGISRRTKIEALGGLSEDQAKEAAKLYKEGKSLRVIAQKFDVTHNAIRAAFKRQGIKCRSRGEANVLRHVHIKESKLWNL